METINSSTSSSISSGKSITTLSSSSQETVSEDLINNGKKAKELFELIKPSKENVNAAKSVETQRNINMPSISLYKLLGFSDFGDLLENAQGINFKKQLTELSQIDQDLVNLVQSTDASDKDIKIITKKIKEFLKKKANLNIPVTFKKITKERDGHIEIKKITTSPFCILLTQENFNKKLIKLFLKYKADFGSTVKAILYSKKPNSEIWDIERLEKTAWEIISEDNNNQDLLKYIKKKKLGEFPSFLQLQ